ncbi:MAG: hypothetical protein ACFFCD_17945, partial [Promethearchaeota archaeon]
ESANDAKTGVDQAHTAWSELEEKEQEILARYDGDAFAAYNDIEPIAIQMDGMHTDLEIAYKPYLEHIALTHILCASSLEAHINLRAKDLLAGQNYNHFDRLTLEGKWLFYPKLIGAPGFNAGEEPFQSLSKLVKNRNALIHFKGKKEEWKMGEMPSFIRKLYLDLENAEKSINAVKGMVKALATQLKEDEPDWIEGEPLSYFTFFSEKSS